MVIEESKIHKALLEGGNVLNNEITNGYHCIVNPISAMMGDKERLQAIHERGNFCLSFKLWANGQEDIRLKPQKCVRVWHTNININKQRFQLISDGLSACELPYFTKFEFKEEGVNVEGTKVPAIFMDWIDAKTLTKWIPDNKATPDKIKMLADKFKKMCIQLNSFSIAHGDLCCENILVTSTGEIKLVDYDSIYVPMMGGLFHPVTAGWPDFQHPKRVNCQFTTAKDDFFSQHVIYLSLLAYSHFPSLIPEKPEKAMLFNSIDYLNETAFTNSKAYRYLVENCNAADSDHKIIMEELHILRNAINSDVTEVVPLENQTYNRTIGNTKPKGSPNGVITPIGRPTSFNPTRPISNSTRTTSTHVETPWYKQWYTWVGAAVFAGLLYIGFANSDSKTDDGDAVRTEMVVSTAISRLEGNYTLREKNAGVSVNGIRTAAIKKTSESQARILVSTEYGPEFYDFTLNANGQIESEQLGKGEITYNEKLDKITLTFKQGERICEFAK